MNTDNTEIVHHDGGTTMTGDAITLYRVRVIEQGIRMWIKTKMMLTRGASISHLLKLSTQFTGKKYKNTPADHQRAADDLKVWCDTMRAAIPVTDKRTEDGL